MRPSDRNPDIKAWDSLTPEEQKLYARFFESLCGLFDLHRLEIGRLVNHLKEIGQRENTLIFILHRRTTAPARKAL